MRSNRSFDTDTQRHCAARRNQEEIMTILNRASLACLSVALASCTAPPLSEQLAGRPIPPVTSQQVVDGVEIAFSADRKYETSNGVPFAGDPLVCSQGKVSRVNREGEVANRITVKAGEEIGVASVIAWVNTGFRQVCGPFVTFTPEPGTKYVVVNERIGGKGISSLWTGMARQTCKVSVYRETSTGFSTVQTRPTEKGACRVPEV
jgi:hypothetical protein